MISEQGVEVPLEPTRQDPAIAVGIDISALNHYFEFWRLGDHPTQQGKGNNPRARRSGTNCQVANQPSVVSPKNVEIVTLSLPVGRQAVARGLLALK